MKKLHYSLPLAAAILCAPLAVIAADPTSPGKSSDAVKEPAAKAPERAGDATAAVPRQPGKASDGVSEPTPDGRFRGKITAVNKAEKTVTFEDTSKGSHTIHIGTDTKLTKGTETVTWDQLSVGQEVEGTSRKVGEKMHAETLMLAK